MKRTVMMMAAMLAFGVAFAQEDQVKLTESEYAENYTRQVQALGVAGVGVETILDRWIADYPENATAYEGKFLYYWVKSQVQKVVDKPVSKYLGLKPVFHSSDTLGKTHYYFEETFYNDELFGQATKMIDKAISLQPALLNFRCEKILALIEYEKDSPDMAMLEVSNLIDLYHSGQPDWVFDKEKVTDAVFAEVVQDFCSAFFRTGTTQSYAAFLNISKKMNKLYPKDPLFIDNIGSYYLVVEKDYKKAVSYYKKALKVSPNDATALKNIELANKMIAAAKAKGKSKR